MKHDLIDKIIEPINRIVDKKTEMITFSDDNDLLPLKIDKGNFYQLGLFSKINNLIAIDGGNANLISTPNFSVDCIRLAAVKYINGKRSQIIKKEFFIIVDSVIHERSINYQIRFIGDNLFTDDLKIGSKLISLDGEKQKLETGSIATIVRRYSELKFAKDICNQCEKGSAIVVDGSVKSKTNDELKLVRDLISCAKENGVNIGFLSKSCMLLTENASCLSFSLNEIGPKSSWYYYPAYKANNNTYMGEVYFVKLCPNSEHVFKLDIANAANAAEYILTLSLNSNDPIFYGYPFCLIDADSHARISNKEKEYLRTILLSKIRNKERLRYLLASSNSHSILDKISY